MAAERMLCEPLPRPSWLIEWVGFFALPEAPPGDLPAVDVRDFLAISPDVVLSAGRRRRQKLRNRTKVARRGISIVAGLHCSQGMWQQSETKSFSFP